MLLQQRERAGGAGLVYSLKETTPPHPPPPPARHCPATSLASSNSGALWVRGMKPRGGSAPSCVLKKRGRRREAGGGEKGDSRETRKERWVGAVAIRKDSQENWGSSNHRGAISNAYQVTAHFQWKVGS